MGPNEQNQHLTELRQKAGIYVQKLMLQRDLPSLDGKHNLFVTKKEKKWSDRLLLTVFLFKNRC